MDPVGLAGNIITFIDFSIEVLSRARQLYESASGATAENDELESLTKNPKTLSDRIQRRPSDIPQKGHFRLSISSETVLDNLSQQCIQVADELLETLGSINRGPNSETRLVFPTARLGYNARVCTDASNLWIAVKLLFDFVGPMTSANQ
jgi:hypothetical protein